jgi:hypothetical protein
VRGRVREGVSPVEEGSNRNDDLALGLAVDQVANRVRRLRQRERSILRGRHLARFDQLCEQDEILVLLGGMKVPSFWWLTATASSP